MGITDLAQNLEEDRDHVLVIGRTRGAKQQILKILEKRPYKLTSLTTIAQARDRTDDEVVDLVIVEDLDTTRSPEETVAEIRAKTHLRRVPVVLLRPDICQFARVPEAESRDHVVLLELPPDPGLLLVKVAMALRLWKIEAQQSAHEAAVSAQNARLRDLTNRYKRELREAQEIQESILPRFMPEDPRCSFEARYLPLEGVGGDFYDVWRIDKNRFGVFLGDVTGHGLPAALIGSMTKMALSYASKKDVKTMLAAMNDGLSRHMPAGRFLTAIAAIYDASDHTLSVGRAGHPPAFLWRKKDGTVERLQPKGMPLGVHESVPFEGAPISMSPGDRVFFVTDGLTEAISMNNIQLGLDGTQDVIARACAGSPTLSSAVDQILELRSEFAGGRIVKDDISLIGVERSA